MAEPVNPPWSLVQFPNLPESSDPALRDAVQILFKGLKDHVDAIKVISGQITTLQSPVKTASQGSGVAGVGSGGTGTSALAPNGVVIGQGANPVQAALPGAMASELTSNGPGTNPSFQSPLIYEVLVDETGVPVNATLSTTQVDCLMVRYR